jgi:hypothetical protein
MTTSEITKMAAASLTRDPWHAARHYIGGRRALLALAIIALIGGVAFNWSWLVAAGFAPILLSTLPCLVMCGLGLCANKLIGRSCAPQASQLSTSERTDGSTVPAQAPTNGPQDHLSSCCNAATHANLPGNPAETSTAR